MKPTKDSLREEIEYRLQCIDEIIKDSDDVLSIIMRNEYSILQEILQLIAIFGNRIGYSEFEISKHTPIKDYLTKEPLKIGDKVKASNSGSNGTLYFDDYTNQYVIRNEFGQHNKPSNFIKINENFGYSIDNSKVECRPNPHKQKW